MSHTLIYLFWLAYYIQFTHKPWKFQHYITYANVERTNDRAKIYWLIFNKWIARRRHTSTFICSSRTFWARALSPKRTFNLRSDWHCQFWQWNRCNHDVAKWNEIKIEHCIQLCRIFSFYFILMFSRPFVHTFSAAVSYAIHFDWTTMGNGWPHSANICQIYFSPSSFAFKLLSLPKPSLSAPFPLLLSSIFATKLTKIWAKDEQRRAERFQTKYSFLLFTIILNNLSCSF